MVGRIDERPSRTDSTELTAHERGCEALLEDLVESRGDLGMAPSEIRDHLEGCPDCGRVAGQERALAALLSRAADAPASEVSARGEPLDIAVTRALPARSMSWRILSVVPILASMLVVAVAATLAGGVPGAGLLRLIPAWSSQGLVAATSAVSDWTVVLDSWARNRELLVPIVLAISAALVAGAGLTGLTAATLKARKTAAWSRRV